MLGPQGEAFGFLGFGGGFSSNPLKVTLLAGNPRTAQRVAFHWQLPLVHCGWTKSCNTLKPWESRGNSYFVAILAPQQCPSLPFFGWEGSSTKIAYRKKIGYPYSNLSNLEDLVFTGQSNGPFQAFPGWCEIGFRSHPPQSHSRAARPARAAWRRWRSTRAR